MTDEPMTKRMRKAIDGLAKTAGIDPDPGPARDPSIIEWARGIIQETRADCDELAAEAERLRAAARSVEEWWLSEGMKHFNGAPYAIFATRAALAPVRED